MSFFHSKPFFVIAVTLALSLCANSAPVESSPYDPYSRNILGFPESSLRSTAHWQSPPNSPPRQPVPEISSHPAVAHPIFPVASLPNNKDTWGRLASGSRSPAVSRPNPPSQQLAVSGPSSYSPAANPVHPISGGSNSRNSLRYPEANLRSSSSAPSRPILPDRRRTRLSPQAVVAHRALYPASSSGSKSRNRWSSSGSNGRSSGSNGRSSGSNGRSSGSNSRSTVRTPPPYKQSTSGRSSSQYPAAHRVNPAAGGSNSRPSGWGYSGSNSRSPVRSRPPQRQPTSGRSSPQSAVAHRVYSAASGSNGGSGWGYSGSNSRSTTGSQPPPRQPTSGRSSPQSAVAHRVHPAPVPAPAPESSNTRNSWGNLPSSKSLSKPRSRQNVRTQQARPGQSEDVSQWQIHPAPGSNQQAPPQHSGGASQWQVHPAPGSNADTAHTWAAPGSNLPPNSQHRQVNSNAGPTLHRIPVYEGDRSATGGRRSGRANGSAAKRRKF